MAIQLQVFDGVTPVLDFIATRHRGLAREALSVTGSKLQAQAQRDIRKYTHHWHHGLNSSGKRVIYKSDSKKRVLGTMTKHSTRKSGLVDNVGDIISSYLPKEDSPHALSVTVGGGHKTFTPIKYRNGEKVGTLPVVKARGSETRAIFEKLNTGKLGTQHPYQKRTMFPSARYVKRPFMDNARSNAEKSILESLDKRYRQVLPRLVKTTNLKIRKVG